MSNSTAANKQLQKKNGHFSKMVIYGFLAAVMFITTYFDLFGLKKYSADHSAALFQRLFSSVHYDETSQSRIGVFLINDKYLVDTNSAWPMDYTSQLKIIIEILARKPKAIYLDFLYKYKHGTNAEIAAFIDAIADAAGEQIPVVIPMTTGGEGYDCDIDYTQTNDEVVEDKKVPHAFEGQRNFNFFKKSYIKTNNCRGLYPLMLSGNTTNHSPAFAMYKIYCEQNPFSCPEKKTFTKTVRWERQFTSPLAVQWGVNVSENNYDLMPRLNVTCQERYSGFLAKLNYNLIQFVGMMTQVFDNKLERGKRAKCPYADTYYASLGIDFPEVLGTKREFKHFEKIFDDIIRDNYVFIGASVEANRNWVGNPINGKSAGVYRHAMAFDNLTTYGPDYFTAMPKFSVTLIEIVAIFFILLVIHRLYKVCVGDGTEPVFADAIIWVLEKYHGCLGSAEKNSIRNITTIQVVQNGVLIAFIFLFIPLVCSLIFAGLIFIAGYTPFDWITVAALSSMLQAFEKIRQMNHVMMLETINVEKDFS